MDAAKQLIKMGGYPVIVFSLPHNLTYSLVLYYCFGFNKIRIKSSIQNYTVSIMLKCTWETIICAWFDSLDQFCLICVVWIIRSAYVECFTFVRQSPISSKIELNPCYSYHLCIHLMAFSWESGNISLRHSKKIAMLAVIYQRWKLNKCAAFTSNNRHWNSLYALYCPQHCLTELVRS